MLSLFAPVAQAHMVQVAAPTGSGGTAIRNSLCTHLHATEGAQICLFAFRSTEPKNQRTVQSQTRQRPILPNFCFLYLCFYQESNCTCD